jgi:hypothetical protein
MPRPEPVESLECRFLLTGLVIDPIVTAPIDEGDSVAYQFTVHDDDELTATHQYQLNWGDGSQYTSKPFPADITVLTAPGHVFRDNGPAPEFALQPVVMVWSRDDGGNIIDQVQQAFSQVVRNVAPLIADPIVTKKTDEGSGLQLEYLAIDPGLDDVITVTADWGDGDVTVSKATRVNRPPAGFDALLIKPAPYQRAGAYDLGITSHDDDGGTLVETTNVTVLRQFTITGNDAASVDQDYTLTLQTTNPDSDLVDWQIDWGDGQQQIVSGKMSASSPLSVAHQYTDPTSFRAGISATPREAGTEYPASQKLIDVVGPLPAQPAMFKVETSANTQAGVPYAALRQVKLVWENIVPQRIDSFDVQRSDDGASDWAPVATNLAPDPGGFTSWNDSTVTHTSFYRVVTNYNPLQSQPSVVAAARMEEDYGLEVRSAVNDNPVQIVLSWTPADAATAGFRVFRKAPGESTWHSLTEDLPPTQNTFNDEGPLVVVEVYEYRVDRLNVPRATASPHDVDTAYVMAGAAIPLDDDPQRVILVIDSTLYDDDPDVVAAVATLRQDLIGERFDVSMLFVQPSDDPRAAHAIRDQLVELAAASPLPINSIFLIGHVPAPYSGHGGYDNHNPGHLGAWSTDAYYGDLIASRTIKWWTDLDTVTDGFRDANKNKPRDGRFDDDVVPDRIEVPVGRVDFFEPGDDRSFEAQRLIAYLQKDHRYRTGQMQVTRDAIIDVRRERGGSTAAIPQYSMLEGLVGRDQVHTRALRDAMQDPSVVHLFATGIAHGSYDRMFDPNHIEDDDGNLYYYYSSFPMHAVFLMTTGSLSGDFYSYDEPAEINRHNLLREVLADGEALIDIWVEYAPLELHPLGLGQTVGQSLLRTLNNTGEYDQGRPSSTWGSITLNLMGDPTLRMTVVPPVSGASAMIDMDGAAHVSWEPMGGATFRVYRAVSMDGPFEFVGETVKNSFLDPTPGEHPVYMIRAVTLQQTFTATYYAGSTGTFVQATQRVILNAPHRSSEMRMQVGGDERMVDVLFGQQGVGG